MRNIIKLNFSISDNKLITSAEYVPIRLAPSG
ncbi:hypothetical protein SDC9_103912 [bioreactor metagenome]|uniref:Uncharacterized protein n=1 Tax=bioreactor metagenome TaxID=1076179 RepID=A0A645B5T5_9ZZZZ